MQKDIFDAEGAPADRMVLDLRTLPQQCPALTEVYVASLAEAASVCLEAEGHPRVTELIVSGMKPCLATLVRSVVTEQMDRSYGDPNQATEWGACAVAIMVARPIAGRPVVERSWTGTGFDYWLGSDDDDLPFQRKARLEVSGVRSGGEKEIRSRVALKKNQTRRYPNPLPCYIVVVEFNRPEARVLET